MSQSEKSQTHIAGDISDVGERSASTSDVGRTRASTSVADMARLARGLLTRPRLIPAAIGAAAALAPRKWWTKPPYLPLPDAEFIRFRQATANGDPDTPLDVKDFIEWLEWRRLHEQR